jgi:hypothetical protein
MKIILVVMLELAVLHFCASCTFTNAERTAAERAIRAESESRDASAAFQRANEKTVNYADIVMRCKLAAIRAFRAEAEYQKYLLQRAHAL